MHSGKVLKFLGLLPRVSGSIGLIVGSICVAVLMVTLFVESVVRESTGVSLIVVDEVAGALLVVIVFSGISWVYRKGTHLRMGFLADRLPDKLSHILRLVLCVFSLAFTVYIMSLWWKMTLISIQIGRLLPTMRIIEWPIQTAALVGWVLLFIVILEDSINILRQVRLN